MISSYGSFSTASLYRNGISSDSFLLVMPHILCSLVRILRFIDDWCRILRGWILDQGQGGAQSIEDGAALGILFSRLPPFTTADDLDQTIAERLEGFESVRKDRASVMQILSNAGQDEPEKIRDEAKKFLKDGVEVPGQSNRLFVLTQPLD